MGDLQARERALRARAIRLHAQLDLDELEAAQARLRRAAAVPGWVGVGRDELGRIDAEVEAARERLEAAEREVSP